MRFAPYCGRGATITNCFTLDDAATPGPWSIWARATISNFDGKPDTDFELDGDVTSACIGMDYLDTPGARFGIAISQSDGEVDYDDEADGSKGDLNADLSQTWKRSEWSWKASAFAIEIRPGSRPAGGGCEFPTPARRHAKAHTGGSIRHRRTMHPELGAGCALG